MAPMSKNSGYEYDHMRRKKPHGSRPPPHSRSHSQHGWFWSVTHKSLRHH